MPSHEQMNTWSSTITIHQGDEYLDISSAAMGKLSMTPIGATNPPFAFPKGNTSSVYQFYPEILCEYSWQMLKDVLTKVGCVSGCRLMQSHVSLRKSCNRLATYSLRCTHGVAYPKLGSSTFEADDIGPGNVVTKFVRRAKTKCAIKGNSVLACISYLPLYKIIIICFHLYKLTCAVLVTQIVTYFC